MQSPDTHRVKMGDADWKVQCLDCGTWFEAARSDATFCSAACRIHYNRAPQRKKNTLAWLKQTGREVQDVAVRYKHSQEVFDAILNLRKQLEAALDEFELGQLRLIK